MIYNVKTIEYLDSLQIRTYRRPVTSSNKINIPVKNPDSKEKEPKPERTSEQIEHSIRTSVNRTVGQIYMISRANKWEYFVTLTIDPKKLDNANFNLISEKLNIWTNNLKKRYAPNLKYILVPELHKDKTKWHFHGLFANIGKMPLAFSGKVCIGKFIYDYVKKPFATKIYNIPLWKYGFSTATEIRDSSKASSYITKYITKDLSHILQNQHRYLASQNIDKPLEKVYNLDYEELARIYGKYLSQISYVSDVKIPGAGQEITYMEFNKTAPKEGSPEIKFKLFEPEEKAKHNVPICSQNHQAVPKDEKSIQLSHHVFTGNQYIEQLRNLQRLLKDQPELKKVYRDINVDYLIAETKRKIMYEEEEASEEDRPFSNDFIPATGIPFI